MEEVHYQIYNKWFDSFIAEIQLNGIIYLDVDPPICRQRIHNRNRNGEDDIPLEYLVNCDKYHKEYIQQFNPLCIDGNENLPDYSKVMAKISTYVNEIVNSSP